MNRGMALKDFVRSLDKAAWQALTLEEKSDMIKRFINGAEEMGITPDDVDAVINESTRQEDVERESDSLEDPLRLLLAHVLKDPELQMVKKDGVPHLMTHIGSFTYVLGLSVGNEMVTTIQKVSIILDPNMSEYETIKKRWERADIDLANVVIEKSDVEEVTDESDSDSA